jgi:branched-chain amino acid transport system substrate-binding protein
MSRKTIFAIIAVLVVIAAIIGIRLAQKPAEGEVIKIGAILPLTGNLAFVGENFQKGMLLFYDKENLNEKGIYIEFQDHKNDPKSGISEYRKLLLDKKVYFIVPVISSIANAIASVSKTNHIIILASVVSATDFPDISDWVFRYYVSAENEAATMVKYWEENKVDKVGVIYVSDEYGLDFYKITKDLYGKNIIFSEAFDKTTSDFRSIATKVAHSDVKNLYLINYSPTYGVLVKQIRETGYKGNIYGNNAFAMPIVFKQAGKYAEGVVITAPSFYTEPDTSFIHEYKTKWGNVPDHYSGYGYDLMSLIYSAIQRVRNKGQRISSDNLCRALRSIKNFRGIMGESIQEENGNFLFTNIEIARIAAEGTLRVIK